MNGESEEDMVLSDARKVKQYQALSPDHAIHNRAKALVPGQFWGRLECDLRVAVSLKRVAFSLSRAKMHQRLWK